MSLVFLPPPRIHWTGCGYYYTNGKGVQLGKMYRTLGALRRYGRINLPTL